MSQSKLYYDLDACKSVLDKIRDIVSGYHHMTKYHNEDLVEDSDAAYKMAEDINYELGLILYGVNDDDESVREYLQLDDRDDWLAKEINARAEALENNKYYTWIHEYYARLRDNINTKVD